MEMPPPPVELIGAAPQHVVSVASFRPGPVLCGGSPVAAVALAQPFPITHERWNAAPAPPPGALDYRFSFTLDADGRPGTIRRINPASPLGFYLDSNDLAPALAASRFAPGSPGRRCTIAFTLQLDPVETAPLARLYEIESLTVQPLPPEIAGRTHPAGSTCPRGPGGYRRLNNPAFETIGNASRSFAWSYLSYDTDPRGTVRGVRLLGSSGNAALDKASIRAVSADRFAPGPGYRGCIYHFYKTGGDILPAPMPADTPAETGDMPACRVDDATLKRLLGSSAYPAAFARRRIEGFAAVRYDTAPWGAIGNVAVLVSEPDEAFGAAARAGLSQAHVAPSPVGHSGCVQRIRFRLPPSG
ncbi:TonB family protein [Sphingomonas sp. PAMC 26605]|uniref:TonB family protein n=1 Tax=Sphingomonas sp. PAMC 26605 TaxID=1112214 RepID=UPI00026CA7AD|nr:TonB family protein [Sphingomonas sp. PAMC 26605]